MHLDTTGFQVFILGETLPCHEGFDDDKWYLLEIVENQFLLVGRSPSELNIS